MISSFPQLILFLHVIGRSISIFIFYSYVHQPMQANCDLPWSLSLVQIYLDSFLDFSQSICNSLKKNIENKTIPEDCYHRMKLRKPINSTTLEANRILLESKGVTKYNNFSIKYSTIAKTVKLVILVITRWSDKPKRKSIRNILASFRKGKNKYHKKYSYIH